ncbi:hypothetical protein [Streptomyces sp. NPDC092370]|uniref:hypothetical protein n=1 Tax=Streptomyces sp. NPDC092370 TaxID=3366016 RepID=UPI0038208865
MRAARDDVDRLNAHEAAFHRAVVSATGNEIPPHSPERALRPHSARPHLARSGRRQGRRPHPGRA